MKKTGIRTYDVFNFENKIFEEECYVFCYNTALKCNLQTIKMFDGTNRILYLAGLKHNIVKYYFITLLKTEHKFNGIRRLIKMIFA